MKPMLSLLLLATLSAPAALAQSARELMDKARDRTAAATEVKRVDSAEVFITVPGRPRQGPQRSVVTIEIDQARHLARQTGAFEGKDLVLLKQGDRAAIKVGTGDWQIPTGPFAQMAKDMGNLFVCEIEAPETKENAPDWRITGSEVLNGRETITIESAGDSAIAIAQKRVSMGIAKAVPDPAQRPSVKVLAYSAKHWIDKADFTHRQTLQQSKLQFTLSDGKTQLIQETKALSTYAYAPVNIEIPEAAQRILSPNAAPAPANAESK